MRWGPTTAVAPGRLARTASRPQGQCCRGQFTRRTEPLQKVSQGREMLIMHQQSLLTSWSYRCIGRAQGAYSFSSSNAPCTYCFRPVRHDAVGADVHVKKRSTEVLAGQGDADLGVRKVCEPRWKEAACQIAILCSEKYLVTSTCYISFCPLSNLRTQSHKKCIAQASSHDILQLASGNWRILKLTRE